MPTPLSPELYWAVLATILTSILWMPHIIKRIVEMGPYEALRDPRHDEPTRAPWAQRAIRAHTNAIENLVVFGLLAVMIHVLGVGDHLTATAAAVYFWARLGHYGAYVRGMPWIRTPLFLIGFACQMVLAARLLGWA